MLAHPTGRLEVRQNVAPLNVRLKRFGAASIKGHDRFRLESSSATLQVDPVDEHFAGAQFDNYSEDEKLKKPSFEKMQGGVSIGNDAAGAFGVAVKHLLEYECIALDAQGQPQRVGKARLPWDRGSKWLRGAALGRSAYRKAGLRRFQKPGAAPKISVGEEDFVVVRKDTLAPVLKGIAGRTDRGMTHMEADRALEQHVKGNPADQGALIVVPEYEALAA